MEYEEVFPFYTHPYRDVIHVGECVCVCVYAHAHTKLSGPSSTSCLITVLL